MRRRASSHLHIGSWRARGANIVPGATILITAIGFASGCQRGLVVTTPPRWSQDLPAPALVADSAAVDTVAGGVLHRAYQLRRGPWMIHVLDVDLSRCWSVVALKGFDAASGRKRTSELVAGAASSARSAERLAIAGGVNGDFFLFAPAGVPVGALLHEGRVITGPVDRPVFAIDSTGRPWLGTLRVEGGATSGTERIPVTGWNRHVTSGLALFDGAYGPHVDSLSGTVRVVLDHRRTGRVLRIDTNGGPTPIPRDGAVLVAGARAGAEIRDQLLILARTRGRFDIDLRLMPHHPREVIGGFPLLVQGGMEVPRLDSAGAPTFAPVRHPRTIAAVSAAGRRLMLVTVDGRQPGHSAGMTLREAARLALDLGATEAINLDGGGSTTLVVVQSQGGTRGPVVVNRPSDPQGERAVANALGVASCG